MKFTVNKEIFDRWPDVKIGVIVGFGAQNSDEHQSLAYLRSCEESARNFLTNHNFEEFPAITEWRKIYKEFGTDPKKYRSSVEALIRRVGQGKDLPDINPLVNYYNAWSIKYLLPFGAEDLDHIEGDIELSFSDGSQVGTYIGSNEQVVAERGEVIYKDTLGFICNKWNYREADRTKITESTRNFVLVSELCLPMLEPKFNQSLDEATTILRQTLGAQTELHILSRDSVEFEIK
jgi:DNA/RNA-binding domain of Phe-tRNA-synthetase-like protein